MFDLEEIVSTIVPERIVKTVKKWLWNIFPANVVLKRSKSPVPGSFQPFLFFFFQASSTHWSFYILFFDWSLGRVT